MSPRGQNQAVIQEIEQIASTTSIFTSTLTPPSRDWFTARAAIEAFGRTVEIFEDNEELVFIGPSGGGATPVPLVVDASDIRACATAIISFALGIALQESLSNG